MGEAGVVPLETPKPLSVLRAALGEVGFFWSGALVFALAPACLGRLTKRLHGTRTPAPLLGEGLALAALVLAIGFGSSAFEPWERTRELHARGRMHREVRGEVLAWLREHWVGTEGGLVTGNSLEVFAHRLGPAAARRMLRFREVATWPDRLGPDPAGVLVAISQDTSGHGLRFRFLQRGEAVGVPEWGVRFEPRATLQHAGRTVGMIFDYRPLGGS